jgi:hypothetical protein
MRAQILAIMFALLVAVGAFAIGSVLVGQSASALTSGQQVVLQASQDLTSQGLIDVKLLSAVSGKGGLSGRVAISSVTIAQFGGSQAIGVSLRAATCDNANGFGSTEEVVVPQDQTVHLDYPSAMQMPFVATAPTSWCLFAETLPDNGTLTVTVVATKV